MKIIPLKSFKQEFWSGLITVTVSGLLMYWGVSGTAPFHLFGMAPDASVSHIIFVTIALLIFIPGLNTLIKWFSVLRNGAFVIVLDTHTIPYPRHKKIGGSRPITLKRTTIARTEFNKTKPHFYQILIKDKQGDILEMISGQLTSLKTLAPKEVTPSVNNWLKESS